MRELIRRTSVGAIGFLIVGMMAGITSFLFAALSNERANNDRQHEASRQDRAEMHRELSEARAETAANHIVIKKLLESIKAKGGEATPP